MVAEHVEDMGKEERLYLPLEELPKTADNV